MKDELGDRMKSNYENITRFHLPKRTYTILRIDGKAFHTYTRGLMKPFDTFLTEDMNHTALYLCSNIQGAKLAYVQSDEISVLLTDFDNLETSTWFDGNIQKISSVAASMATARFNVLRTARLANDIVKLYEDENHIRLDEQFRAITPAMFDCRSFTIPQTIEVYNYFVYRNKDAICNAISMIAQSLYNHKELDGVSSAGKIDLINKANVNYHDYADYCKFGSIICKAPVEKLIPNGTILVVNSFVIKPAWNFNLNPQPLLDLIPTY